MTRAMPQGGGPSGLLHVEQAQKPAQTSVGNKTIWTLWYQGVRDAPPLVRACMDSWRRLNPGWRVVALDRHNLAEWIPLQEVIDTGRADLPVQKIAAVSRLALLRR